MARASFFERTQPRRLFVHAFAGIVLCGAVAHAAVIDTTPDPESTIPDPGTAITESPSTITESQSAVATVQSVARVARPAYNTGHGLFVLHGQLYDSNGTEFRIRGVNLCHYDSTVHSAAGIARSKANTVRMALWLSSVPTSTYINTLQSYVSDRDVVIPTMFRLPGTKRAISGSQSTADLAAAVSNWVANVHYYAPLEHHLIINVANEWGPRASPTWASAYQSAIARLRAAGYTAPIMIDAGAYGQDTGDLLTYTRQVFNSDPQKNVIFSFHVYSGTYPGWTAAKLNAFALQLKTLSTATGM